MKTGVPLLAVSRVVGYSLLAVGRKVEITWGHSLLAVGRKVEVPWVLVLQCAGGTQQLQQRVASPPVSLVRRPSWGDDVLRVLYL